MKHRFLLLFTLFVTGWLSASAYDFMVNDIAYIKNSDGKSVSVTYTTDEMPSYDCYSSYKGKITIPEKVTHSGVTYSVTSIGNEAFASCKGLTSVTIPNSVTYIGSDAFMWSGLTSLTIPNSVTSIDFGAFRYCSELTSINLPNSITEIANSTFYCCEGLTSITIPNSVISIKENAFEFCTSLKSIDIPNNVKFIGVDAFSSCI